MRGKIRKGIVLILSAVLSAATLVTVIPQMSVPVYAAGTDKDLQLGHAVIGKGVNNINGSAATVYFGSQGEPLAWRVIGYNGDGVASSADTATLLASDNIGSSEFDDTSPYSHVYAGSKLQSAVNSIYTNRFTSIEDSNIRSRTLQTGSYSGAEPYTDGVAETAVSDARLWPLSTQEAYYTNSDLRGASALWWLRSPGDFANLAALVSYDGDVYYYGNRVSDTGGVRPAFNINLSSIILTSAASGGKDPGTGGAGTLNEVAANTVTAWKLTISDSTRSLFTASAGTGATVSMPEGYTSWTVPITYSNAQAGENEHVSAILTNSSGVARYYGYIATNSAADTKNVTIPTGLTEGTYTLNIFNEQCNGNYKTDLSSPLKTITLTVTEAPTGQVATPTFSPVAGTYSTAQNVAISCTTGGATIHYTMDGSTPTAASATYNDPINVSETKTIKAIAVKDGMTNSSVASATYTISDTPIAVTGVSVAPTEVTLKPDATKKLTATVKPDNASNKDVTWRSDDEDIASVSSDGTVTAKAEGETYITVTTADSNKSAKCKVIVDKDAPVVETCTISFDANGGKGEMDDQTVDKGVRTQLNKNRFTRSGYSFDSWNTDPDGDGSSYDDKDYITVEKDTTLYAQWKKGKPRHDDDEETEEPSKPAVVNPDTVEGYFAVNGQPVPGVAMGKTVQGVAAQAVFNATRPAGFLQAFTFNMAVNGKVDYTLKNGVPTIIIPKEFQKAGRTFAIMALDKNGKAWTFADTDTNPATVTATINVEGYAFALIYKD